MPMRNFTIQRAEDYPPCMVGSALANLWLRLLTVLVVLFLVAACSSSGESSPSDSGQTDIASALNSMLEPSGSGVLLRVPDGLDSTVVPATFTRNDIYPPTQMYVNPPQCTGTANESATDGYVSVQEFVIDFCSDSSPPPDGNGQLAGVDPFLEAAVGVVVGTQLKKFDSGIYYPTDSNSTDKRCRWNGSSYDCPGSDGKGGAGSADGKGCDVNQVDAPGPDGLKLVSDPTCRCEAKLSGNGWADWIDHWLKYASNHPGVLPEYTYFTGNDTNTPYNESGGQAGKAPMFAMDWSSCWVSDINDLVALQNAFWRTRETWFNGLVPQAPDGQRDPTNQEGMKYYWGWNETPVSKSIDSSPSNWDSIVVKLPAGVKTISELSPSARSRLSSTLDGFVKDNSIPLGKPQDAYVLTLTESQSDGNSDVWQRKFSCQPYDFNADGGKLKINYLANSDQASDGKGACWLSS